MHNIIKHLLYIISVMATVVLVACYHIMFGTGKFQSTAIYLVQQVIPNLIASLVVFIVVYFFIERVINKEVLDWRSVSALSSSEERRQVFEDRTTESIRLLSNELKSYRKSIEADISGTLDAVRKSTTLEERTRLDSSLKKLYVKLNDVDLKVANIDERLAFVQVDEREQQIKTLSTEVQRLNTVIESHKAIAQQITSNAKKI